MRVVRLFFLTALAGTGVAALLAPGCHTPTQVTLDIVLANAKCGEVNQTAITVGVDPDKTEANVRQGFVTASTTDCNAQTNAIGTLVVTPGDEDHGAVVVVVAYGPQHDATQCKPPDYTNCIVARRSFGFIKHSRLHMPITIDPDCLNVPCDAFSTCKHGECYSSAVQQVGDDFVDPGVNGDGAVQDAVVPDAGGDAPPVDDAGRPAPQCKGGLTLFCADASGNYGRCDATNNEACIEVAGEPTCGPVQPGTRYCCANTDCGAGFHCTGNGNPQVGKCEADEAGTFTPYCKNGVELHCKNPSGNDVACVGTGSSCCVDTCGPGLTPCAANGRRCCADTDCAASDHCVQPLDPNVPGHCEPRSTVPGCDDAGVIHCGAQAPCPNGSACCKHGDGTIGCSAAGDATCTQAYCCGQSPDSCSWFGSCSSAAQVPAGPAVMCNAGPMDAGSDASDGGAMCVGLMLYCTPFGGGAEAPCPMPGACCGTSTATAQCGPPASCVSHRYCCQSTDCPDSGKCMPGIDDKGNTFGMCP